MALGDLNRSWEANLLGRYHPKSVHRIRWISPPTGLLKLKFDGSYIMHIHLGGVGGVIWDSFRNVVKNFSGPVSLLGCNGAEIYALLVGCCELCKLGGCNAIIEGHSFFAIKWGSGKSHFPWRLADLVEEEGGARYFVTIRSLF